MTINTGTQHAACAGIWWFGSLKEGHLWQFGGAGWWGGGLIMVLF